MPRGMSLVVMETAKAVFKYIEWSPFCFDVHGSIRLRVPILLLRRRSVPWGRCTLTYTGGKSFHTEGVAPDIIDDECQGCVCAEDVVRPPACVRKMWSAPLHVCGVRLTA